MDIAITKNIENHIRKSDSEPGVKNLQGTWRRSRSQYRPTDIYSVMAPACNSSQIIVNMLGVGNNRLAM